jgi:hypothetical protein
MSQDIIPPEKGIGQQILADAAEQQDYADRDQARMNMIDTMNLANEAVAELTVLAKQSQHPRAFEALAKLIDSATNANKAIYETQIARKKLEIELDAHTNNPGGPANVTNNLVFNGSTAELLELLNKK